MSRRAGTDLIAALPAAVLGNGSLLATVSGRGRVQALWWPHPDREQLLDELRLGIEHGGATRWLDEAPFEWRQSYAAGSMVLRTTAQMRGLDVEIEDLVHPTEPALIRRISCSEKRARLVAGFRGSETLGLATSADEVVCAAGASHKEARQLAAAILELGFARHVEARQRHDVARVAAAQPASEVSVAALYERSLLVFDALADRETGAVIAAPELDPDFVRSGGYGFVWARDLAFLALAFLAARRGDLLEGALRWLPGAQEQSGLWLQRHWTDGSLAPSWNAHQLDETGTVLFAYEAAWRELRDETLDAALWPSARSAAGFLLGSIEAQGIPCETADLWEERDGCHAYTAAAIVGGLRAAASFARRHEPERADTFEVAAERLAGALDRCFWSDEHGRYLRTLGDPTVDVSLLGLAWPFGAVDPRGPRMRATAEAVEQMLGRPGGGITRYERDTYAGGNPWVLGALWLGLYRRQIEDAEGHARSLDYVRRVATPLQLLAEQVTDEGEPAWVLPLAWSHAMLVLAARPELELVRTPGAGARSPVRAAS
ncbi:MAG: glycoside hydrolase family 15 protein [Gaiellaceae bacterium]